VIINIFHIKYILPARYLIIGFLGVLIGGSAGAFLASVHQKEDNASFKASVVLRAVQAGNPNTFEGIRDNISDIIDEIGIDGVLQITHEAFKEEDITMFECHVLAHLTGHAAKVQYADDYEAIIQHESGFCELGYRHGIGAQIASEGGDFRQELYLFCALLRTVFPQASCYHGAGHGFMREFLDLKKALAACNTLTEGPEKDLSDCHKGVFSEYTNLIGGIDGETGLPFSGGAPLKLNVLPIDFCASLLKQYQMSCSAELNGLWLSPSATLEHIERSLQQCTSGNHALELKAACIRSKAAVSAQHELPIRGTITLPPFILSLPPDLRKAYISGAIGELNEFLRNGVQKDWRSFCDSFPGNEDRLFCEQRVKKGWN